MITADPASDSGGSLQRKLTGGGGLQPRHTGGGGNYLPPRQSGGGKPPLNPPHQKRVSRQSATLGCSSEDKENKENEVKPTLHMFHWIGAFLVTHLMLRVDKLHI